MNTESTTLTSMMPILFIVIIGVGIFLYSKNKKKKKEEETTFVNKKKDTKNNEPWIITKKYLQDTKEIGKEIIEIYVAKRKDPRDITNMNKEEKFNHDKKLKELKQLKKTNINEYKIKMDEIKKDKKIAFPEEYIILFKTRNAKTKELDEPRAIQCAIVYNRIAKNDTRREVVSTLTNYEEEMIWIAPIKEKDDIALKKRNDINEKNKINRMKKEEKKSNSKFYQNLNKTKEKIKNVK